MYRRVPIYGSRPLLIDFGILQTDSISIRISIAHIRSVINIISYRRTVPVQLYRYRTVVPVRYVLTIQYRTTVDLESPAAADCDPLLLTAIRAAGSYL
jgi:hypothetical protein